MHNRIILLAGVIGAVGIAACGGSGSSGGVVSSPGSDSLTVDGITFSGPAFQAAEKACTKLLPGGGGLPPPVSAAQRRAAIANAYRARVSPARDGRRSPGAPPPSTARAA
jgi:hypothetical protein